MTESLRRLTLQLRASLLACVAALGFALLAAHCYRSPRLIGSAPAGSAFEWDFWFSLGSALTAGIAGAWRWPRVVRPLGFAAQVRRVALWFALTCVLWFSWAPYLHLLTLLIAPTHALLFVHWLFGWRALRVERAFRRPT